MKNKGFTLIELLAVIVILAIIALIATPIILGIINDTKKESAKISAENYIDGVEQAIIRKNLTGKFNPSRCDINGEGNLVNCEGTTQTKSLEVEVDGTKPTSGIIKFLNGSVAQGTELIFGSSKYVLNDKGELELGEIKEEIPEPVSFADDSWATIAANVKAGNIGVYENNLKENTNNTKIITLTSKDDDTGNKDGITTGDYLVRIANTTTPEECNDKDFSQTACGFVVEFVDIITTHEMNPAGEYKEIQYDNGWNVDGYPASSMYSFLNDEDENNNITSIYESLPQDVRNVIKYTKVISSHGNTAGETNFESTDKLYLLSTKEVWGKEGTSNVIKYDTAEAETRQLDYYEQQGVTTQSGTYGAVKKNYNGTLTYWWLRSAYFNNSYFFYRVTTSGAWTANYAININGVAPAFRIG